MAEETEEETPLKLYRVTYTETRTVVFFVEAPDQECADEDATELAASWDGDWDTIDEDVYAQEVRGENMRPVGYDMIWSGGPQGEWRSASDD